MYPKDARLEEHYMLWTAVDEDLTIDIYKNNDGEKTLTNSKTLKKVHHW